MGGHLLNRVWDWTNKLRKITTPSVTLLFFVKSSQVRTQRKEGIISPNIAKIGLVMADVYQGGKAHGSMESLNNEQEIRFLQREKEKQQGNIAQRERDGPENSEDARVDETIGNDDSLIILESDEYDSGGQDGEHFSIGAALAIVNRKRKRAHSKDEVDFVPSSVDSENGSEDMSGREGKKKKLPPSELSLHINEGTAEVEKEIVTNVRDLLPWIEVKDMNDFCVIVKCSSRQTLEWCLFNHYVEQVHDKECDFKGKNGQTYLLQLWKIAEEYFSMFKQYYEDGVQSAPKCRLANVYARKTEVAEPCIKSATLRYMMLYYIFIGLV